MGRASNRGCSLDPGTACPLRAVRLDPFVGKQSRDLAVGGRRPEVLRALGGTWYRERLRGGPDVPGRRDTAGFEAGRDAFAYEWPRRFLKIAYASCACERSDQT